MWIETVDISLASLKLIPNWFVTSTMIQKLYAALYADDGLLFPDEDSGNVTFFYNEMDMLSVNLNNIDPDTIFLSDFWLGIVSFKKAKRLKKIS